MVWDDDLGKDDEIGRVAIDLSGVYKRGVVDKWYDLTYEKGLGLCGGNKVTIPAGEIRVVLTFFGEEGVKYPAIVGKVDPIVQARLEKKHEKEQKELLKQSETAKEERR